MDDSKIVSLYWERDEKAIEETVEKYGRYCHAIASNILYNEEDAEESVNDTYLSAWNSMPPHRPVVLSTFLGKLTRRISLKKWRDKHAQKRGSGEPELALEELMDCIPSGQSIDEELQAKELTILINQFLRELPQIERRVFICRYWYLDPVTEICRQFDFSQSKVKSMLYRTREKLKSSLKKEGVFDEI